MLTDHGIRTTRSLSTRLRLAASAVLCGGLAALAGATAATSMASAASPKTATLSTVPAISVFAGDGGYGKATPGPARSTDIGYANGLAVDRFGNTYIADGFNYYAYKVTPGGTLSVLAGNGTNSTATPGAAKSSSIGTPAGIAADNAGNVYIGDFHGDRVYKVTPGGTLSNFAGTGFTGPVSNGSALSADIGAIDALTTDASGNLYIASHDHNQIYKVTPGGALSVIAGVYQSEAAATPGQATNSSIGIPQGVAVDRLGNLYITDDHNEDVYKVTPSDTLSVFAGNGHEQAPTPGAATSSSLGEPIGVAVDGNNNVFITDNFNELLYRVTASGTLSVYAGQQGSSAAATPGPASHSALGMPVTIAIDPASGYQYVFDGGHSSLLRITPAPGYWLASAGGFVSGVTGAVNEGSLAASPFDPVVGIASDSAGYWLVTKSGAVHAYGDAGWYKDLPSMGVHVSNIVAIAPTQDRRGYWLIGADGGEFAFGDASFHGSLPGLHISVNNIVGMVANPNGAGYILVGSDGGVFVFGQGNFYGSLPGLHIHVNNIRGILPTGQGAGYVLVGSDGGAFVFGHGSGFYGSLPGQGIHVNDVVGLALTPDQGGYWMAEANGTVHPFGDAPSLGTPAGTAAHLPVVGIGAS
jgi:sugar lactone lactonase YvrE